MQQELNTVHLRRLDSWELSLFNINKIILYSSVDISLLVIAINIFIFFVSHVFYFQEQILGWYKYIQAKIIQKL